MHMKSWIATVGIGMAAGAAAVLMLPKHSDAYRIADNTARTIKQEAGRMLDSMKRS